MQAFGAKARSVTMVYRKLNWKIPYFFGGLVNFKQILYSRLSESMFMPWAPSALGRLVRKLFAPLIWLNWRALEKLLNIQFNLSQSSLQPSSRIEDDIHCSTSIATPGFFEAVKRGNIRLVRGELRGYEAGCAVTSNERLEADLVILAIGWRQELPFLAPATLDRLVEPDGQYRLYRTLVNPDLPDLGFVGFNSSFASPLSAELGAQWLARWFEGSLPLTPNITAMHAEIDRGLSWKRHVRRGAAGYAGLCIAPFHYAHFDELMIDMGARCKSRNPIKAYLLPIDPQSYERLLKTAAPIVSAK